MQLKKLLKGKLTKKEQEVVRRSYDMIGDIAIIEIPRELEKKEKLIAKTLLDAHKQIKVVAKKVGAHKGIFRTQKLKIIAGQRRKTTEYKESGLRMRLNVEKCYFSPRLGTERLRIAKQVKPNEVVLVLFSGIAPYPLVIAKQTKAKEVHGVEINPVAHKYAQENVKLNKLGSKIMLIQGDVKGIIPGLTHKYDRILMPAPYIAEQYLDLAFSVAGENSILHFYDFQPEGKFAQAREKVRKACKKAKKKCRILRTVKCGQSGVREYRICVDVKLI